MAAVPLSWLSVQLGDVVHYGKTEKCELSDVTGDTWILELEDIEKDSSKIMQQLDHLKVQKINSVKEISFTENCDLT